MTDKGEQIAAFRALLTERRAGVQATIDAARAGTRVDGSHRPANRGERGAVTAQGYLAAGLGARLADIDEALARLAELPVGPRTSAVAGARVTVEDDDGVVRTYLILPGGSGETVDGVVILSPTSPIVRAIAGRAEGDVGELERGGQIIELEVVGVE